MISGIPSRRVVISLLTFGVAVGFANFTQADAPTAEPGVFLHHFEYDPLSTNLPQHVAVGGDFNKWSQTANPMVSDGAGHFVTDVNLAEGPYAYRFYVDGGWVNDDPKRSEADLEESNGIRGHNSEVFVGLDGR